jgi:hypothetical protein
MPMPNSNVTRIEDLPELSDIENSYDGDTSGGLPEQKTKYSKYIRNYSRDSQEKTKPHYQQNIQQSIRQNDNIELRNQFEPYINEPLLQKEMFEPSPPPLNCLDVCNHIKNCPLCSKFYKNDNTLYVIIIVILLILTIILTKKVLNV